MKTKQSRSAPTHLQHRYPRLPSSQGGHPADGRLLSWLMALKTVLTCSSFTQERRPQG